MTDPIVETAAGRLRGVRGRGALRFAGVPYAEAARFEAPRPVAPWPGARDARAAGPVAPQPQARKGLLGRLGRLVSGGEAAERGCLTLNVWTPEAPPPAGARRPVMVWIHGGAFVFGSGSTPVYSGRRLARRGDVVVVTINYRLGAFGFLHADGVAPDADIPTNLGLRDQIAALAWVRENIEAFGGDPGNVTIFGESAGAMSVGALLGTPAARGLFHRAILQSGAAHNVSDPERAFAAARALLAELGLEPARAARLRDVPVPTLLEAQLRAAQRLGLAHGTLPWQPAVDDDLLPQAPRAAIAGGVSKDVPVMLGWNAEEWGLFLLGDRKARRMDEAALRRRLVRSLGDEAAAERVLALYRETSGRRLAPVALWSAYQTDRVFAHPAVRLAEARAGAPGGTWVYLYDWAPPLLRRRVGACHAIELPLVFGTWRHPALRALYGGGSTLRALSREIMSTWTAFAREGRPGAAAGHWPAWEPAVRATRVLGAGRELVEAPRHAALALHAELDDRATPA